MRIDILPLCDKHHRTMEYCIAPFSATHSVEYFHCTDKFCQRCFSEALGYVTPRRNGLPEVLEGQLRCERHGRPMLIASVDRQRNILRYACPEEGCAERVSKG